MGKRKNLNSDQFVEEAIQNCRDDRAMASALLIELVKILKQDETKHQYSGPVAAKYLETLQRSNEQPVVLRRPPVFASFFICGPDRTSSTTACQTVLPPRVS